MSRRSFLGSLLIMTCIVSTTAQAVVSTNTWTPAGNGVYTNQAKWSPAIVPDNNNGSGTNYVARIDGGLAGASAVVIEPGLNIELDRLIVSVGDTLTMSNSAQFTIAVGAAVTGTVVLASDGSYTPLSFIGTQSLLGTGQVLMGGTSPGGNYLLANSGTLTIGSGITIHGGGNINGDCANPLVNLGTITADNSNRELFVSCFVNQGRLAALNGGMLELSGNWGNTGVISNNAGFLYLGGTFTTAGVGGLKNIGGTNLLSGTLVNSNTTFTLNATTGSLFMNGGTIQGGTVNVSGGAQLLTQPFVTPGTLDGVTLNANLTVTNGASYLYVVDGLTNNAVITLASDGNFTAMHFTGPETLAGTGQILMGGSDPIGDFIYIAGSVTNGAAQTIHGGGNIYGDCANPLVNLGTITADNPGSPLYVSCFTNQGRVFAVGGAQLTLDGFVNTGTITVTGGGTLQLQGNWSNAGVISGNVSAISMGGTFTTANFISVKNIGGTNFLNGTLVNTNSTLALTATTGSLFMNGGTIQGGTVSATGGAQLLTQPSVPPGTLDGVTLNANLTVTNGVSYLYVVDGLTNNAVITLASDGPTSAMYFIGPETLAGTGQILMGGSNPIGNYIYTSGSVTNGAAQTIHGAGNISGDGANAQVNLGTISADNSIFALNVLNLVNQGSLSAINGGILSASTSLTNSGTVTINNSSTLQFLGGDYVQTAGNTVLNGGNLTPLDGSIVRIRGGSLTGSGFVDGIVTNGGTIAPGFSAGILTFTSNLTQTASGTLSFELGGYTQGTQYDFIVVSNSVRFAGNLAASFINNYSFIGTVTNGANFTVLKAGKNIVGAFANATNGASYVTTDGFATLTVRYSGTSLVLSNLVIRDSVGDSIPNWWRAAHFGSDGASTNSTSCAQCDPDGDGQSNLAEYLTGTDPTGSASAFRITSVAPTGNSIRITWTISSGKTNALQVTGGASGGSYATNGFSNLFIVTNTVGTVTNYVDVGGVTNFPARYYRVRLVP